MNKEKLPVLPGFLKKDTSLVVFCPWCGNWNRHSRGSNIINETVQLAPYCSCYKSDYLLRIFGKYNPRWTKPTRRYTELLNLVQFLATNQNRDKHYTELLLYCRADFHVKYDLIWINYPNLLQTPLIEICFTDFIFTKSGGRRNLVIPRDVINGLSYFSDFAGNEEFKKLQRMVEQFNTDKNRDLLAMGLDLKNYPAFVKFIKNKIVKKGEYIKAIKVIEKRWKKAIKEIEDESELEFKLPCLNSSYQELLVRYKLMDAKIHNGEDLFPEPGQGLFRMSK